MNGTLIVGALGIRQVISISSHLLRILIEETSHLGMVV